MTPTNHPAPGGMELADRADHAIKALRGSDYKALISSYSVAQSLAEIIEQLLDALRAAQPPVGKRTIEECAKLVDVLKDHVPQSIYGQPSVRVALSVAARAIRRGRHLSDGEKLENLATAMEEDGDADLGQRIRSLAQTGVKR